MTPEPNLSAGTACRHCRDLGGWQLPGARLELRHAQGWRTTGDLLPQQERTPWGGLTIGESLKSGGLTNHEATK